MTHSFQYRKPGAPEPTDRGPVLVTGAAGRIGSNFAEAMHDRYDLVLMVRRDEQGREVSDFGNVVVADLGQPDRLAEVFDGIDTVVHLAADPSPDATWESLLPNNIEGTYNVFAAAHRAGCRRVVYASSIHAVSGYPPGFQVHTDDPVNPGDLYGVSKCFGEAMARYAAVQLGLSSIVIRIGGFQPRERAEDDDSLHLASLMVTHRDLNQLICRCIDDDRLQFAIVHGVSGNAFVRMDISEAAELLGYHPVDDYFSENPELAPLELKRRMQPHDSRHRQG